MEWIQTTMQHSKYHGWSLLDPRPVCYYDKNSNAYLAVWNGIYMTRNQAMMIASEKFLGVWATPTMKSRAWKEFKRAYYSGAFGHREWDGTLERLNTGSGHYTFLSKVMREHLMKMKDYKQVDVLTWFNLHKDIKNEA